MKIKAYLKPHCGWSRGVRAILSKYDLAYEDLDITGDPSLYQEMVERSGQQLSPCVEVNGIMLADVSGEEVEHYLLQNRMVEANDREPEAPIDRCCSGPSPDTSRGKILEGETVRFF